MVAQGKTFQEQHKKFFKIAFFSSLYPPGIEEIIKSKIVLNIVWCMGFMPILLGVPYVVSFTHYLIVTPPESTVLRIQVFRRAIIIAYMGGQIATHVFRFRAVEDLFLRWNNLINQDFCIPERKLILDKLVSTSTTSLLKYGLVRFSISQLYNVPLLLNRYQRSSELAGLPHDNNSPYHFVYVGYQTICFFWIGISLLAVEFLYCYLMCMAEAEMKVLGPKLSQILSTLSISDKNRITVRKFNATSECAFGSLEYKEAVQRVNQELLQWLKAHQVATKWMQDLKNFMHLVITIKYTYLGVHCSLVVIGLSGMSSRLNDLILIMAVTVANFSFCFYATAQADRLYDDSERLFSDAYGQAWYLYPVSTQKLLATIATFTQARPVVFFGFKIYRDSKENFSAVLQTAYQVLTFILPMAES